MKSKTKTSFIVFIITATMGYLVMWLLPDSVFEYTTLDGFAISMWSDGVAKLVGMRVIIAVAIGVISTLLIRIVDSDEKEDRKENERAKNLVKKEIKEETIIVKQESPIQEAKINKVVTSKAGVNKKASSKTSTKKLTSAKVTTKKATEAKTNAKKVTKPKDVANKA